MESNRMLTEIQWRKSSYSGDQGGNCIEIAEVPDTTLAVRDSKTPAGPILTFTPTAFTTFVNWSSTTSTTAD